MITKIDTQEDWNAASIRLDHLHRMCSEDEFITTLPPAIVDDIAKEIEPLMALMSEWDSKETKMHTIEFSDGTEIEVETVTLTVIAGRPVYAIDGVPVLSINGVPTQDTLNAMVASEARRNAPVILDGVLANLRRLYHHVLNGGTVSDRDLSLAIQSLEKYRDDL